MSAHTTSHPADPALLDISATVGEYLHRSDWRVNANANQGYSLGGLILNTAGKVIANYWLNEVYTPELGQAHRQADLHIHDLDMLSGYCAGWSLRTLLHEGLNGVPGKVEAAPPKHLSSAIGQMVNFLGTLQNEWAGAQAFSSFDTYLAPFIRKDNLDYATVRQCIQEFVYNLNVPSRWGTQTPFTNITFDWVCPDDLRELLKRGNGLFGSAEQTGSLGAVTVNYARLGYLYKGDKLALYARLSELMDLARDSLETKRQEIGRLMVEGLFPYTKRYLGTLRNHFSTIGVNGLNEMVRNFTDDQEDISTDDQEDISTEQGRAFALELLDHVRERMKQYQEETGLLYLSDTRVPERRTRILPEMRRAAARRAVTVGHDRHFPKKQRRSSAWITRNFLLKRRGLLDAVVFSGGEPTIQPALLPAMQQTRTLGFRNGLHTGVPQLRRLTPLLPYLDWVVLDIKALPSDYELITTNRRAGLDSWAAIDALRTAGVDFEYRLTWHGALQSAEQVVRVGRCLAERGVRRFAVQPARSEQMLNDQFGACPLSGEDRLRVCSTLRPLFETLEFRA